MGRRWVSGVGGALRRARDPILWMSLTYALGFALGTAMVHRQQAFALAQRDAIVGTALASDPAARSLQTGRPLLAALYDFGGNLVRGAIPSTIMGLGIVLPFPVAAHRGWIGGLVSVDGAHASRFGSWREGSYFAAVVFLQLVPYILAGGAGVRLGLANLMPKGRFGYPDSERWMWLPAAGIRDVLWIYTLIVPLFLVASLVEFLAR